MRLLLTGASGYFGRHFAPLAARRFETLSAYYTHPEHITAGGAVRLDLKDAARTRLLLAELQPQVIVHAAASNHDEQNLQAILPAARALAGFAHESGARLIHFSTDVVFGGGAAPYDDDSLPCPVGRYGRLKAQAEAAIAEIDPAAVIVRPSLIYGFDPPDAATGWLLDGMRRGETVRLFTDEIRCPVWVDDLCAAVLELAAEAHEAAGAMNLAGPQPLNRWEFGMRLLKGLGLAAGPTVIRATVIESGLERARDVTVRSRRAGRLLKARLRSVDEAVSLRLQAPQPEIGALATG
jgi:dTDP-4-dehydrorhamnose reductase